MSSNETGTRWKHGRFDARPGPRRLLFGQTYEDAAIEMETFAPGGRVFCIAGAGDTAFQLATAHDVVAVDINPLQIDYVETLLRGAPRRQGSAERLLSFLQALGPLAGWTRSRVDAFLDLSDPTEQWEYWRRRLDTRRFRFAFDLLLSLPALRWVYAPSFLSFLPRKLGAVLSGRLERGFTRHSNRTNPYAKALLRGERMKVQPPADAGAIRFVWADAAGFLEGQPSESFIGFSLSNILDGAGRDYVRRLAAAVKRAAAPEAMVVLRSFREPSLMNQTNRAASDRAMIWGVVDVQPAAELGRSWGNNKK